MMHPNHPPNSSSSALSSSSVQRDRDRQREQRQRQILVNQNTHNVNPIMIPNIDSDNSHFFPEPVRLEQTDDTSVEISQTLGPFAKLRDLVFQNYPTDSNPSLIGISKYEMNRRRVNEILAEMTRGIPSNPVTGLEDLTIGDNYINNVNNNELTSTRSTIPHNSITSTNSHPPPIVNHHQHQPQHQRNNIKSLASSSTTATTNRLNELNTHNNTNYPLGATISSSQPIIQSINSTNSSSLHHQQQSSVLKPRPSSSLSTSSTAASSTKLTESKLNNREDKSVFQNHNSNDNNELTPSKLPSDSSDDDNNNSSSSSSESSGDDDDDDDESSNDSSSSSSDSNDDKKDPSDSAMDIDAKVKLKNDDSFDDNNKKNEDQNDEDKWDLANFLPPGSQDLPQQKNKDTQSLNDKMEIDSNFSDRKTSKRKSKNSSVKNNKLKNSNDHTRTKKPSTNHTKPKKQQKKNKTVKSRNNTNRRNGKKYSRSKVKSEDEDLDSADENNSDSDDDSDSNNDSDNDSDSDNSIKSQNNKNTNVIANNIKIKNNNSDSNSEDSLSKMKSNNYKKHKKLKSEDIEEGELNDTDHHDINYNNNHHENHLMDVSSSNKSKNKAERAIIKDRSLSPTVNHSMTNYKRGKNNNNSPSSSPYDVTKTSSSTKSTNNKLLNEINHNSIQNHKKKSQKTAAPSSSLLLQPPTKFVDESSSSSSRAKNRIPKDENSWKDIKKRKDSSSVSAKSKKSNTNINNNTVINEPKIIPETGKSNRLTSKSTPSPTPPSTSSSKYSPNLNKPKENCQLTEYTRKVELVPSSNDKRIITVREKFPDLPKSLRVSIDCSRLKRIPNLNYANDEDSVPKSRSEANNSNITKEKSPSLERGNHYRSNSNGKDAANNTKSKSKKPSDESIRIKSEINDPPNSSSSSSRHLTSVPTTSNHLNVPSPQRSDASPIRNLLCSNEDDTRLHAKAIKRKADLMKNHPLNQTLLYIEACLYFALSALITERKQSQDLSQIIVLYRETINLIKFAIQKVEKMTKLIEKDEFQKFISLKIRIVSYRFLVLLSNHLLAKRGKDLFEFREPIWNLYKAYASYVKSGTTNSFPIPLNVVNYLGKELYSLQYVFDANDSWHKSETILSSNQRIKEFFQQIDKECNSILYQNSSLEQLIQHTLKSIKMIRKLLPSVEHENEKELQALQAKNERIEMKTI